MYEVRATCGNSRCGTKVFTVTRKQIDKEGETGPYRISQVVCPGCRMWAPIGRITEVRK